MASLTLTTSSSATAHDHHPRRRSRDCGRRIRRVRRPRAAASRRCCHDLGLESVTTGDLLITTSVSRRAAAQRGLAMGFSIVCALPAHDGLPEPGLRARDLRAPRAEIEQGQGGAHVEAGYPARKPADAVVGRSRQRVAIGRCIVRDPPSSCSTSFEPRRGVARADAHGDHGRTTLGHDDGLRPPRPGGGMTRPTRSSCCAGSRRAGRLAARALQQSAQPFVAGSSVRRK